MCHGREAWWVWPRWARVAAGDSGQGEKRTPRPGNTPVPAESSLALSQAARASWATKPGTNPLRGSGRPARPPTPAEAPLLRPRSVPSTRRAGAGCCGGRWASRPDRGPNACPPARPPPVRWGGGWARQPTKTGFSTPPRGGGPGQRCKAPPAVHPPPALRPRRGRSADARPTFPCHPRPALRLPGRRHSRRASPEGGHHGPRGPGERGRRGARRRRRRGAGGVAGRGGEWRGTPSPCVPGYTRPDTHPQPPTPLGRPSH